MNGSLIPPLMVVVIAGLAVRWGNTLRIDKKSWPLILWITLWLGGIAVGIIERLVQTFLIGWGAGERLSRVETVRRALAAFGLVGPISVLGVVALVWVALPLFSKRDRIDPALCAVWAATGFVCGRLAELIWIEHLIVRSGARAAVLALGDISIAMMWGYGLARSALDGSLGGYPFGRYALTAIVLRGLVEFTARSQSVRGISIALSISVVLLAFGISGLYRLAKSNEKPSASLVQVGRETLHSITHDHVRGIRIRIHWIVIGILTNTGTILVAFALMTWMGYKAHINFGDIDRGGSAAEYAAFLLILGVIAAFPVSASFVGTLSRPRVGPTRGVVVEAGLAAIITIGLLLWVLGVVAPLAIALTIACAPIAFFLATLGAWVVSHREHL